MHIHFIGICGTFMAGLARLATELGHTVTGSDREFYPPMSEQLSAMGVTTYRGFSADVWDGISPDLVIVGNVCSRGMPIIESMFDLGLDYTSGPRWLGEHVLASRYVFAIAGTHGKTTTTAMLTHILRDNGIDAGYLVGGVVPALSGSASLGDGEYFVIEADEYDSAYFDKRPKFIHYHPDTFVVGNAEFDHADIYEHIGQIENQFHYGVRLVPPAGTVIFGQGDSVAKVKGKGVWSNVIDLSTDGYGLNGHEVIYQQQSIAKLPEDLIGTHNQNNALVACLAAQQAGITIAQAAESLRRFQGVKRRLELIAEVGDIRVYDDFAHHPTAVDLTLSAIRTRYPERRIVSVLEPRSNTMKMGQYAKALGKALAQADCSYVYLPDSMGWQITGQHRIAQTTEELLTSLLSELRAGDEVIIMSNGSFNGLHQALAQQLEEKYG